MKLIKTFTLILLIFFTIDTFAQKVPTPPVGSSLIQLYKNRQNDQIYGGSIGVGGFEILASKRKQDSLWSAADLKFNPLLISGVNIKSINGINILGSGNIEITGGGSTVATWGSVAGTLADQTDLISALELKANGVDVLHKTGSLAESITGNKTFTGFTEVNTVVPSSSGIFRVAQNVGDNINTEYYSDNVRYNQGIFNLSIYAPTIDANYNQTYQKASGIIALTKNFAAGQTIDANTTGNAATASNSAKWNTLDLYLSGAVTSVGYIMAYDGTNNRGGIANNTQVKNFLGTTLQDVTTAGNTTTTGANFGGNVGINGNISAANLISGTYTPVITPVSNVPSSTSFACTYQRVGNVVTVAGYLYAFNTATGSISFTISLPIASSLNKLSGTAYSGFAKATGYVHRNNFSQCEIVVNGFTNAGANNDINFIFQYLIE